MVDAPWPQEQLGVEPAHDTVKGARISPWQPKMERSHAGRNVGRQRGGIEAIVDAAVPQDQLARRLLLDIQSLVESPACRKIRTHAKHERFRVQQCLATDD